METVKIIPNPSSWLARFLMVIDSQFYGLLPLERSVRLPFLTSFRRIGMSCLVVIKKFQC